MDCPNLSQRRSGFQPLTRWRAGRQRSRRPPRKWGPDLRPGPTLACWRSIDWAIAIPVGRWPNAFECRAVPASLPLVRVFLAPSVPLARSDRLFAATFPAVLKNRQSSIAPLHRRPSPSVQAASLARRPPCWSGQAAIASPGGGALVWSQGRNPRSAPLLRIPERRIRTASSTAFRGVRTRPKPCSSSRVRGHVHAALATFLAVSPACFPAFTKTAFGRLAHLPRGRIACRSSSCFSKACAPIRNRFLPPRQGKAAPVRRVAQDLFSSLIHTPRRSGG